MDTVACHEHGTTLRDSATSTLASDTQATGAYSE
jgi:hypothetical protein